MTALIAALVAVYAVSVCFVISLLTRTLWHERSTPVDAVGAVVEFASAAVAEQPVCAEAHPTSKTA